MTTARQEALDTLTEVSSGRASLSRLLPEGKTRVRAKDRALYQILVYGALREWEALGQIRDRLLSAPLSEPALAVILNLGLFQLLRLDLGDHGVISETVELAHYARLTRAKGLVNAILRRSQREREVLSAQLDALRGENLPPWLRSLYPEALDQLAAAATLPPPFTLRLAPQCSQADFLARHPEAQSNPLAPEAVTLPNGYALNEDEDFLAGRCSVQDAGAQWAAHFLNPQSGERILDACAAPGGKTTHLLERAPTAEVVALDSDPSRLQQVRENLDRLGQKATLLPVAAQNIEEWWDGRGFNAILLDAPCSGSGVLRRHPDIRFLRTERDFARYPKVQFALLKALWRVLAPGGRLLYATCSLLPQENNGPLRQFLATEATAAPRKITAPSFTPLGFGVQHLPDAHGDGFFYALLEKSR